MQENETDPEKAMKFVSVNEQSNSQVRKIKRNCSELDVNVDQAISNFINVSVRKKKKLNKWSTEN